MLHGEFYICGWMSTKRWPLPCVCLSQLGAGSETQDECTDVSVVQIPVNQTQGKWEINDFLEMIKSITAWLIFPRVQNNKKNMNVSNWDVGFCKWTIIYSQGRSVIWATVTYLFSWAAEKRAAANGRTRAPLYWGCCDLSPPTWGFQRKVCEKRCTFF